MDASAVLTWALTLIWLGAAVWVYFDARRVGRSAWMNAIAIFVLPGLGLAVYLGTRGASQREDDAALSENGQALLAQMTVEIERLRGELAEARAELEALGASR